jgi:hypothetical protein
MPNISTTRLSTVPWMLLLLGCTATTGLAADGQWQFGTTSSFSSGTYGTDARTEVFHTPITARRLFADGDVTFVFPFTCIRGDGGVTVIDGTPVRRERLALAAAAGRTRTARVNAGAPPPAPAGFDCGMGDIVVRGRYYLIDRRGWMPTVAIRGHLKAPTASAERGLGTGRPDEGIGVEVSRSVAGGVVAMVDGGYTIIGKPQEGVELHDIWWYDVGVGRDLANGFVNLSVFFEEYRAIVGGVANARDILTALSVGSATGWRAQVSGQFGLSDGAPERAFTFGASRRF